MASIKHKCSHSEIHLRLLTVNLPLFRYIRCHNKPVLCYCHFNSFACLKVFVAMNKFQGWEFAHLISERIAAFFLKNERMRDSLNKMSDSLIHSFLVSEMSDLLTSLIWFEQNERFTHIAHQKKRKWAIRSFFRFFFLNLKGAVSRDFLALFYFMNRSHLGPW